MKVDHKYMLERVPGIFRSNVGAYSISLVEVDRIVVLRSRALRDRITVLRSSIARLDTRSKTTGVIKYLYSYR